MSTYNFRFIHNNSSVTITPNMDDGELLDLFRQSISDFDPKGRYVAVQDQTSEYVVYQNEGIYRMADSG